MPNIVEIAVADERFSTLVTAVQVAGLVEALQSPGPFTVFAPLNSAFEKLPPGTVTSLVQNPPQLGRTTWWRGAIRRQTWRVYLR
jgi:uncharacterized surface protein with fasciclin (FAS1) repeats